MKWILVLTLLIIWAFQYFFSYMPGFYTAVVVLLSPIIWLILTCEVLEPRRLGRHITNSAYLHFLNMQVFKILISGIITIWMLSCEPSSNHIWGPSNAEYRLWWLFDKNNSRGGPTSFFICVNEKKYCTYSITRYGKLRNLPTHDVIYPLVEEGKWEIKNDSLFLQGKGFSKIKKVSDTVYLWPGTYLLDVTDKFDVTGCNCDSLTAQFKGGYVDSIKTILNYKK